MDLFVLCVACLTVFVNCLAKPLRKLSRYRWGTNASTIRPTALALSYSVAEYAALVWARSAHAYKLDSELNSACRAITGCLKPTNVEELYLLSGIAPPSIRCMY